MDARRSGADDSDGRARLAAVGLAAVRRDLSRATGGIGVEVVRGRRAIAERFLHTQQSLRREMLVLDTPPYGLASAQSQTTAQRELLQRGVRLRTIYDREALTVHGRLAGVRELIAAGEEGRVLAGVPMKLMIADRSVAMVHLPAEDETVLLYTPTLLDGLLALFELLWAQAAPLWPPGADPDDDPPYLLSAEDTRLLRLAATGLTDHAVARRLGVAQRTVERRMRRIMDQLGARTRFQAGLQAAGRGVFATRCPAPPPATDLGARPAENPAGNAVGRVYP